MELICEPNEGLINCLSPNFQDLTPLNQLRALKTLILGDCPYVDNGLLDTLNLPELREAAFRVDKCGYSAKDVTSDTWQRLSLNCPKLSHIYQSIGYDDGTDEGNKLDQRSKYAREIVAKRSKASRLIRRTRRAVECRHITEGNTQNSSKESMFSFDSSEGEETQDH
jgi:hypothetical protein